MKSGIYITATVGLSFLLAFSIPQTVNYKNQEMELVVHLDSLRKINPTQLVSLQDPVCGMDIREHFADTTLINGKLYGFCSAYCKKEFLKKMNKKAKSK